MKQNWEKYWQKIFKELKEKFTIESVLITLDLNTEIRVETDTLDFAIERVL